MSNILNCIPRERIKYQKPNNCDVELSKIVAMAVIKIGFKADNFEEWNDESFWQAAIDSGEIDLIGPTRGTFAEASSSELEGDGFLPNEFDTMTFDQQITHRGFDRNAEMYDVYNNSPGEFGVGLIAKDCKMFIPLNEIGEVLPTSIFGRYTSDGARRRAVVNIKWQSESHPKVVRVPYRVAAVLLGTNR